jgi:hypothetical protein
MMPSRSRRICILSLCFVWKVDIISLRSVSGYVANVTRWVLRAVSPKQLSWEKDTPTPILSFSPSMMGLEKCCACADKCEEVVLKPPSRLDANFNDHDTKRKEITGGQIGFARE